MCSTVVPGWEAFRLREVFLSLHSQSIVIALDLPANAQMEHEERKAQEKNKEKKALDPNGPRAFSSCLPEARHMQLKLGQGKLVKLSLVKLSFVRLN